MLLRFLRWWLDELEAMLPPALLGRREGAGQWLTVDLSGEGARVLLAGARGRLLMDLPATRRVALEGELAAVAAALDPHRVRCRILLPAPAVLQRELELPLAAEENLREVLGFEMSRRTPFRAEDVHFACRVVSRDPAARRLRVHLQVVPRAELAAVFSALRAWDLQPASADAGEPVRDGADSASFSFQAAVFRRRPHARVNAALGLLVAILAGIAIAVPLRQQREHRDALDAQLEQARAEAQVVALLRDRLEARRAAIALIAGARAGRPAMVELLEELTRVLPDDTYLFRIEVARAEVHVHGSSQTASALIALLESTQFLSGVRFASPVTRDGATARERFHIVANLAASSARAPG
jgi:general secretion pathway protein L